MLLLSYIYVAYITKRPAMLPLGDNVSESWENDVFLAIRIHFRLYITHLGSNSSVFRILLTLSAIRAIGITPFISARKSPDELS